MIFSKIKSIISGAASGRIGLMLAVAAGLLLCACSDRRTTGELLNEAVQYGKDGKWAECEETAITVLKDDPANPHALLLRAIAAENLGKNEAALEFAKQASENAPGDFSAQYTYGRMLAQYPDKTKNAILVLKRARDLQKDHVDTLILLVQCSLRINSEEAIGYIRLLPPDVRASAEARTCAAIYYLDRLERNPGNKATAMEALHLAYKAEPDNPVTILNMAFFLDKHYRQSAKGRSKAIYFYRKYLEKTSDKPELNPTRAQVKARISKLK